MAFDMMIGPSSEQPLGTDDPGRDLASRTVHGTRISPFNFLGDALLDALDVHETAT